MSLIRTVAAAIAVLCLATPLVAQSTATTPDTIAVATSAPPAALVPPAVVSDSALVIGVAAPSWTRAVSAPSATTSQSAVTRAFEAGPTRENTAMMIVGGAGLIVGSILGGTPGTLIAVGGGVVGLIGLWDYFK